MALRQMLSASNTGAPRRAPSTIYELGEEEELIQQNQSAPHREIDQIAPPPLNNNQLAISAQIGHDEGDGSASLRRISDSPEPVDVIAIPETQGRTRSFETLILNLMMRAKIRVFLADNSGVDFIPVGGYRCQTPEIINSVIQQHKFDENEAHRALSIWFSDRRGHLEVQLKPTHNPFAIEKLWKHYLHKFTDIPFIEQQVPIVRVRRSLWMTLEMERQLTSPGLLQLLFYEAKQHFVAGRYIFGHDQVIALVGLLLYKEHGRFSLNPRNTLAVRSSLHSLSPVNFLPKSPFSFTQSNRREEVINKILDYYRTVSARSPYEICLRFLHVCRDNPLYGAAFFPAHLEPTRAFKLSQFFVGVSCCQINVAVNERGLFIITKNCKKYPELLLALPYGSFEYHSYEPPDDQVRNPDNDDEAFLLLILNIYFQDNQGNSVGKKQRLLPIISKQVPLIAACIESFLHMRKAVEFSRRESMIAGEKIVDENEALIAGADNELSPSPIFSSQSRPSSRKNVRPINDELIAGLLNRYDQFQFYAFDA